MSCILLYEKDGFISKELIQIIQNSFSQVDIKMVSSCEECLAELRDSTPDILMLGSNVADCNGFNLIGHLIALGGLVLPNLEDYEQLYPATFLRQEFRRDAAGAGKCGVWHTG